MKKSIISIILILIMVFCPAVPAACAEENIIHISSADDLRQLAAACMLDTYSTGITVLLDTDLELNGEPFPAIPSFNGIFDGGNHTISGFIPDMDGSHLGLFRYLQKDGVIRNLKVRGTLISTIGKEYIGGIAGSNYGLISNCSFTGTVSGTNYIGGIAGINFGTIEQCRMTGSVSGKRFTGGIAGYSEGVITGCLNQSDVNTVISDETLNLEDLANISSSAALSLLNAEDENVVSDTGGVVGFSKGIVRFCSNEGTIGYPHFGYNVGGVAGRQSGFLNACTNRGNVFGRKDVAGVVGQMEPFLSLVSSEDIAKEIRVLNAYLNDAASDLSDMSNEIETILDEADSNYTPVYGGNISDTPFYGDDSGVDDSSGSISDSIIDNSGGYISDDQWSDITGRIDGDTKDNITGEITAADINTAIGGLAERFDSLSSLYGAVSGTAGFLGEDLTRVNNQFSRVMLLMANALDRTSDPNIFEDVSDNMSEGDVEGRVSVNENYGHVDGDSNVGGVVGAMGIEYEFDLEDALATAVGANGIISNTYDTKCVCSGNLNYGSVTAKKDRAGGMVGNCETGTILQCENYGRVESTEGGYVGGIAGYSDTRIRNSYAMCRLSGNKYLGGIAGFANELTDCASMITADHATAFVGSIAGWADMTVANAVDRNIFVHDSLGAVDGISYAGKAMPVSYEDLISHEDVPEGFRSLLVNFIADGRTVRTLTIDYGASIAESDIPSVPEKAGYSGSWEEFETRNLHFGLDVEAVYTELQSSLASEITGKDSPLSVVLIEGEFENSVAVDLREYDGAVPEEDEFGKTLEAWTLYVENLPENGSYTVRYLTPALEDSHDKLAIYVMTEDGNWEQVETGQNGSYTSFPVQGNTVVFRAVEEKTEELPVLRYGIMAGGSLLALIIMISLIHRSRKRKAKASSVKTDSRSGSRD